jgi:hypothetical protein
VTEIYVAKRTGILREPDGTQHRLYAGKTLAAAGHPAVTGSPDAWRPMTVDLDVPGREETDPGHLEDDFAEELATVEQQRDSLYATLTRIVEIFDERGLLVDVDRDAEGWLVLAVTKALDGLGRLELVEQVVVPELADPETPEGRQAIREWAWANDLDVAERGTIPKAVVEQYRAAHA